MNIEITIDPFKLSNPDLDLRYQIPEMLEVASYGKLSANGYDYDENDNLIICIGAKGIGEEKIEHLLSTIFLKLNLQKEALKVKIKSY